MVSDCSIRVYRSFAWFLLGVFDAALLHEFNCDTARKCVHFKAIIPKGHPIILELFLILFTTHYSKIYSSITYACLVVVFIAEVVLDQDPYYWPKSTPLVYACLYCIVDAHQSEDEVLELFRAGGTCWHFSRCQICMELGHLRSHTVLIK